MPRLQRVSAGNTELTIGQRVGRRPRSLRWAGSVALCLQLTLWPSLFAGPTVVPTSEGQLGEPASPIDEVNGMRFESIRGTTGDVLLGGLLLPGGAPPPAPEFAFLTDMIHGYPEPVPVGTVNPNFDAVFKTPPGSARSRNSTNDGDFVAFSFTDGGTTPGTIRINISTFNENGTSQATIPIDNIPTFPDVAFADTGVAVDDQGRVTVVYSELPAMTPTVRAARYNAITGQQVDAPFNVGPRLFPDVALLDSAGNRLVVVGTDFAQIRGNIIDLSGGTPVVLPEFTPSTTGGVVNTVPAVAADPQTGAFLAVWENFVDLQGDPVNIRGRRFDAQGNPIGNDFIVNQTLANAQGQVDVAYGPNSLSAVVWAGDAADTVVDKLDVFLQVYDADGNPIGGEIRVNTFTMNVQDQPTVRFLPELDGQQRPQVLVAWRDVENPTGTEPRGTGTSYRCFSIGAPDVPIFADGFESGDTTSWSDSTIP